MEQGALKKEIRELLARRNAVLLAHNYQRDEVPAAALRAWRTVPPGAVVVTYVNSSAEVKALSDVCCASGNAVNVVRSVPPEKEIFMVPDRNLAHHGAKASGRRTCRG